MTCLWVTTPNVLLLRRLTYVADFLQPLKKKCSSLSFVSLIFLSAAPVWPRFEFYQVPPDRLHRGCGAVNDSPRLRLGPSLSHMMWLRLLLSCCHAACFARMIRRHAACTCFASGWLRIMCVFSNLPMLPRSCFERLFVWAFRPLRTS